MAVLHAAVLFLIPTLVVSLIYLLSGKKRISNGKLRLPPSPPGLPFLGHLHFLGSLPHRGLGSLAAKHGPVLLIRLGRVPTVLVSSAVAAEEVMKCRDLAFASRPRVVMAERLLYGRDVAFAPYGDYWRQTRRICAVHLLSPRRILSFRRVREEEAAALVERVRTSAGAGAVVDLSELLIAYANYVVSRAAFGDDSARGLYEGDDRGRELRKVEGKARRTFEALDGMVEKVIEDHRRRRRQAGGRQMRDDVDGNDHRDFVDVLLDVNETDKDAGVRLGTVEIKAIILDMFAGGTSTTTTAMEWTMAELITHPRAMRKLQDEIRAAVGGADHVTEDHVDKVGYLKAVVKETLRLHPPVPLLVPREPPADAEILGHHVPARTQVVINSWAIGRDPATWERPDEFWPERFLDSSVDFRGQDFELLPFGAGRRGCPGIGFAMSTLEMAIASLLHRFDWDPAGGNVPGTLLDMSEVNGIAVRIKGGLPLVAKAWFP
uniref:Cytochrome P450 71A1 n=1 Tax=Aegilops tauschii subsp. strangulata TaxID=200361 RepID=A0A452YJU7_AEGTS